MPAVDRKRPTKERVKDPKKELIWDRYNFPVHDVSSGAMRADGNRWFAARYTMRDPYCWTPTKSFFFGGKSFVPLYKCIAFASKDFGYIIQQGPDGLVWAKE